jgi:arabinogalactan endo-1,4-beta-galactosidase
MSKRLARSLLADVTIALAVAVLGCGSQNAGTSDVSSAGGRSGSGGSAVGSGGVTGGGSGGANGAGGASASGGSNGSGGALGTGGANPGTGGASGTAGSGGNTLPSFFFGADITDQEPAPAAAISNLLTQMKAHGFNFVRVRTFVDPKAADGYDKTNGFDDITHTVAFGKVIKDAGMGLLIDFHMSDNWADPGKQCVPVAWQTLTTIADLSAAVHDYTKSAITQLIAGGARPDMVQIGNETTPGMLLHVCNAQGQQTGANRIQGAASTAGWPNLGMLLKAGVAGVKEVDPGILVSFHIDRGDNFAASKSWIDNAIKQGAVFDAFGESCYQQYQGNPSDPVATKAGWMSTFSQLVAAYPNLRFFAAEYGPMEREINDVVFNLPGNKGMGTFDWEPTTSGTWNAAQPSDPMGTTTHALFRRNGNTYTTLADLPLYTQMMMDYASRL